MKLADLLNYPKGTRDKLRELMKGYKSYFGGSHVHRYIQQPYALLKAIRNFRKSRRIVYKEKLGSIWSSDTEFVIETDPEGNLEAKIDLNFDSQDDRTKEILGRAVRQFTADANALLKN